ncbi:hypothetical protein MAR_023833 [Mya arenaria]|uniref:Uncharacterized protein n=1 Tax=Mya arenaria TaxID=6604 RepID=A0ABY7DSX8_MYAAR|nr:hypothetical protein MAR_023833 [Mya arenaria]
MSVSDALKAVNRMVCLVFKSYNSCSPNLGVAAEQQTIIQGMLVVGMLVVGMLVVGMLVLFFDDEKLIIIVMQCIMGYHGSFKELLKEIAIVHIATFKDLSMLDYFPVMTTGTKTITVSHIHRQIFSFFRQSYDLFFQHLNQPASVLSDQNKRPNYS